MAKGSGHDSFSGMGDARPLGPTTGKPNVGGFKPVKHAFAGVPDLRPTGSTKAAHSIKGAKGGK
jgi:hypothetical protein